MARSAKDILGLLDLLRDAIALADEEGLLLGSLRESCDRIEKLAWKGRGSARLDAMMSELGSDARSYSENYERSNPGVAEFLLDFANAVSGRRSNPSRHLNSWGDPVEFYKLKEGQRFMFDGKPLTHKKGPFKGMARVFVKSGPRAYFGYSFEGNYIDPRTMVVPYLGVVERT